MQALSKNILGERDNYKDLRWEDNIKCILEENNGGANWINLAEDRNSWYSFVNVVMNLRVTQFLSC
jgi:hypothetical protein